MNRTVLNSSENPLDYYDRLNSILLNEARDAEERGAERLCAKLRQRADAIAADRSRIASQIQIRGAAYFS